MSEIEYALSYLPMFYDDLESHVICITDVLCNREAANELLDSNETHKWKTTNEMKEHFRKMVAIPKI